MPCCTSMISNAVGVMMPAPNWQAHWLTGAGAATGVRLSHPWPSGRRPRRWESEVAGGRDVIDHHPATAIDRNWTALAVHRLEADARRSADTHLVKLPLSGPIDLYLKDESKIGR